MKKITPFLLVLCLMANFSFANISVPDSGAVFGYAVSTASAPTVTITSPSTGTVTDKENILVSGHITKDPWEAWTDLTTTTQVGSAAGGVLSINADGSFTTSAALSEGLNTITIKVFDSAGNMGIASVTIERTVAAPTITIENIAAQVGQVISVGENGAASVIVQSAQAIVVNFEATQPVVTISITTSAAMETVSVAQELSQKPALVPEPAVVIPGTVVSHYLEITITPTAATPVQVESATIEFKVSKTWLSTNNIDPPTVKLLKYAGQWVELPTMATGAEDAAYKYYSATTSGFSTFVVTGKVVSPNSLFIVGILTIVGVAVIATIYVIFKARPWTAD